MRILGKKYEILASKYLKDNNYKIIETNFNTPMGELDIVAKDGGTLVFVEVKARKNSHYEPYESVVRSKIKKIIKASLIYIKTKGIKNTEIRYDVVSIKGDLSDPEISLIKNAFNAEGYFI